MTDELWTAVDGYLESVIAHDDDVLRAALAASEAAGLPPIQVTATQGRFLYMLARLCRAAAILEVGTLGGYSTIWLARALAPGGRVITLEVDAKHAALAQANFERAGLADRIELHVGAAATTLARLDAALRFDLVFIDADKGGTPDYFAWAVDRTRPGGLIIVDNVVRRGTILNEDSEDADVQGMRTFLAAAAAEPRITLTVLQTVGSKGYDGFALALVT